jgi:hypothetical protein
MRLLILFILEIFIVNIHFLLSRYISINELQFNPLIIISVFLILKSDEEFLFPSLIMTGILADCFFSKSMGPYLSIILVCGFLFKDSRNVLFKDHVVTHVLFTFCFSLIGVFLIYLFGGVFALRAPIIISLYNALLTPLIFFLFDFIKFDRLIKAY